MTIDLWWQSILDSVHIYPALWTAIGFMTFWTLRFLFGHKLVVLRCWLNLHKYEEWEVRRLREQHDEFADSITGTTRVPHRGMTSFVLWHYCLDCGDSSPHEITEHVNYTLDDAGVTFRRRDG